MIYQKRLDLKIIPAVIWLTPDKDSVLQEVLKFRWRFQNYLHHNVK